MKQSETGCQRGSWLVMQLLHLNRYNLLDKTYQ